MQKSLSILLLLFLSAVSILAQNKKADSVQLSMMRRMSTDSAIQILATMKDDTGKVHLLNRLSYEYAFIQAEKGIYYGQQGVALSQQLGYRRGIALCNQSIAMNYWLLGNYNNGLQVALNALHLFEELNDTEQIGWTYYVIANEYRDFGDYKNALINAWKGTRLYESMQVPATVGYAIIGSIHDLTNQLDSALFYVNKAYQLDRVTNAGNWGWLYYLFGNIYRKMKRYETAMAYYRTALPLVNKKDIIETYNGIATLQRNIGNLDSSTFYASEVLLKWSDVSYQRGLLQSATILSENYRSQNKRDSLIKYLDLSIALGNKLYNQENERDIQNLSFNEQLRRDELVRRQQQYRNQLKLYGVILIGVLFLAVAVFLWRSNQHRKKAYDTLQAQKMETEIQKEKAEKALVELKATQAQLIQSEKMASLGELTAGIAHEIQNPLNFVNNFSELSQELVTELEEALRADQKEDAFNLATDVQNNLEKIAFHGRRADSIVKGMLQHSRSGSTSKEMVDINSLVDEYLRLSYHGLRAKDKNFNARFTTNFDDNIGKIEVVPQEIGRVLLNLYNNAFYAVTDKMKRHNDSFDPLVVVSTKNEGNWVKITVRDNGTGIPSNASDKIFQPFFTTKPTGQGTGLGLSLSYDIITKGHNGEMTVESEEGEYTAFTMRLPFRSGKTESITQP